MRGQPSKDLHRGARQRQGGIEHLGEIPGPLQFLKGDSDPDLTGIHPPI